MSTIARHREILERTPATLSQLLRGLPDHWTRSHEGEGTWSPFDVVGHLLHGERTDWMPRVARLLDHGVDVAFDPFDRLAQLRENTDKTLNELLDAFASARRDNLDRLAALDLSDDDLQRPGRHPELGRVTLGQLLATWVAHDLGHIGQIVRVMAKQYAADVGPWRQYLRVVNA